MPACNAVGKFHRHQQHEHRREQEEAFEEQRKRVLNEHAAESALPVDGCNCRWPVKLYREQDDPNAAAAA